MMPFPTESAEQRTSRVPRPGGRRAAMAILAEATVRELTTGLDAIDSLPTHTVLRSAETGLVMVRGRIGGDGAPFNLGEATVTRMALQISSGPIGVCYALGRDAEKAQLAALCDALWQDDNHQDTIERHVLTPVRSRLEAERAQKRAQAAATRVDFFTMVRGED